MKPARLACVLATVLLAACGARTGLRTSDAGLRDAGPRPRDLGPPDTGPAPRDLGPPSCRTTPALCDDGVACTRDTCELDAGACIATPDDTLCPLSHRCDPPRGCVARVLAIDTTGGLYDVEVPTAQLRRFPSTDRALTDIALSPSGEYFAASRTALYRVDSRTGRTTIVAAVPVTFFTALEFARDGTLYGAGDDRVLRIDPGNGAATPVARLPPGVLTSGDLASLPDGRLVLTTTRDRSETTPDELFEVPVDGRPARRLGTLGSGCVWGLAAFADTLYGLTCRGEILLIDANTGTSRVVAMTPARFGGAAAR